MPVQTNAGPLDDTVYTILRKKWVEGHPKSLEAEGALKAAEAQQPVFDPSPKHWVEQCTSLQEDVRDARQELANVRNSLEKVFDDALGCLLG